MNQPAPPASPADAVRGSWVASAPAFARPYLQLSRYDRPAGFWLLGLPCIIGLALARIPAGFVPADALLGLRPPPAEQPVVTTLPGLGTLSYARGEVQNQDQLTCVNSPYHRPT